MTESEKKVMNKAMDQIIMMDMEAVDSDGQVVPYVYLPEETKELLKKRKTEKTK